MRHLRRIYQRPDGSLTITNPAWDDKFSPFGSAGLQARALYASRPQVLREAGAPLIENGLMTESMLQQAIEETQTSLRADLTEWLARFPFDALAVTEQKFYEWAVAKNPRGVGQWGPGMTIKASERNGITSWPQLTVGDCFYVATSEGVTGTVEPAHTTGEVSDGGVTWRYIGLGKDLGDCDCRVDLPPTRAFRDQWRHDGIKVHVDPVLETAERWVRIRRERDKRLTESDGPFMRAFDTGIGLAKWKTYRQALRDLPQTQADPKQIIWPVEPTV